MLQPEQHPIHSWVSEKPVRVLLVGDRYAGKSTLLRRCAEQCSRQQQTAARIDNNNSDEGPQMFSWNMLGREPQIQLQLTDVALRMNAREARISATDALMDLQRVLAEVDVVVLVFSLADRSSFDSLSDWVHLVSLGAGKKYIAGLLVGNKRDLRSDLISYEQALRVATNHRMSYLCASALHSPDDVDVFMIRLAEIAHKLLRYRGNLLLVDRPICPPGCQVRGVHRHVFAEFQADEPLGRIEMMPGGGNNKNKDADSDSDTDSPWTRPLRQAGSCIQPTWLRVPVTPYPVFNLDAYPLLPPTQPAPFAVSSSSSNISPTTNKDASTSAGTSFFWRCLGIG